MNRIEFTVDDPWDFGTEHGTGPYRATVLKRSSPPQDAALFRIDSPLDYKGMRCEYFLATPRHEGDSLYRLSPGFKVPCNLLCIPADKAGSDAALDVGSWRGGVALIATVTASS